MDNNNNSKFNTPNNGAINPDNLEFPGSSNVRRPAPSANGNLPQPARPNSSPRQVNPVNGVNRQQPVQRNGGVSYPSAVSRNPQNVPSQNVRPGQRPVSSKFGEEINPDTLNTSVSEQKLPLDDSTRAISNLRTYDLEGGSAAVDEEIPKKSHKTLITHTLLGLAGLIIGVIGFGLWYYYGYLLGQITHEPSNVVHTMVNESGEVVVISDLTSTTLNPVIEEEHISNFLLIGVDSRYKSYNSEGKDGLADVIMVMSVDNEAGTIKLISIARDSYAYIPGYSTPHKINSAMTAGGPELLQMTVENMLRIEIDGYAYVNFYNMANVIDAVGGVYCDVSSSEVYSQGGLNTNIQEMNQILGYDADYQKVNTSGYIWLNGRQAVAYARIRHVGNGDYERSERQVEVLRSLLDQFMAMSLTGKASAMDDILSCISTNISDEDITNYALNFLPSISNVEIQYLQLPLEGFFNSGMYGDEWSIRPNWNMMIPYVQEFFYGETVEFDPVDVIPSSPSDENCPDDFDIESSLK